MNRYQTLVGKSIGEFKDKGSKFIGYAFPVSVENDCKLLINEISKAHPKSRHVCYAYSIGNEAPLERANDNGEPSNTAGKPILGQIHSHNLNNVLVVVIRYFGGILLGVSGLINAYKAAANDAINNGTIITKEIRTLYELNFEYDHYYKLMNLLKSTELTIVNQQTAASCKMVVALNKSTATLFTQKLDNFKNLTYSLIGYE